MAERRMFAKTIVDSDIFLDMPLSTQNLYFHLGMRADDDGFINNPRRVQRLIGATDDDLKLLIAKGYLITFETGVVVITHWKIHNYIQKDRYKETLHQEEKKMLNMNKNKSYTLEKPSENGMYTECIQNVYNSDTQVRLGKDSIGEDSIGEIKTGSLEQLYLENCSNLRPYLPSNYSEEVTALTKAITNGLLTYDDVVKAFKMANESDFLSGKVNDWQADFRWMIKPQNIQKILNGSYINRKKTTGDKKRPQMLDHNYSKEDIKNLEKKLLQKSMEGFR